MAHIHIPLTSKKDPTGLKLVGRNRDGRYQYASVSVLGHRNIVNLSHPQRVGLALVKAALTETFGTYWVFPMTRASAHLGFGTFGMKEMWLQRPELERIGESFLGSDPSERSWAQGLWKIVVHECGHNFQAYGTKPHGPEFKRAESDARLKLWKLLRKDWPKVDMRKLRESKLPASKK